MDTMLSCQLVAPVLVVVVVVGRYAVSPEYINRENEMRFSSPLLLLLLLHLLGFIPSTTATYFTLYLALN